MRYRKLGTSNLDAVNATLAQEVLEELDSASQALKLHWGSTADMWLSASDGLIR